MKLLSIILWTMLGLAAMPRHVRAESAPPPPEPDKIDLVIVIDEATFTEAVRTRLVEALPSFFSAVGLGDGRSLHVAVLGTNMGTGSFDTCGPGTGGVFQATPNGDCSGPDGNFIVHEVDPYGGGEFNYTGGMAETVACILPTGGQGCAFSQPMAAIKASLDFSVSENDGFLRSDAVLAILVVTGADDCSASDPTLFDPAAVDTLGPLTPFRCFEHGVTCNRAIDRQAGTYETCAPRRDSAYLRDPNDLVNFLNDIKAPTKVVVGLLADARTDVQGSAARVDVGLDGDGNPAVLSTCSDASASAIPATRLAWLAEQFPQRSTTATLCQDQFVTALYDFAAVIDDAVYGNPQPPPPPPPPPGPERDASPGVGDAGEGHPGDAKGCGGCSARPGDSAGNTASLLLGLALLAYLVRRRPAR